MAEIPTTLFLVILSPILLTIAILIRIDLSPLFNLLEFLKHKFKLLIQRLFGYTMIHKTYNSGIVVILGGSTPIGSETAVKLASNGFIVILCLNDLHHSQRIKSLLKEDRNLIVPVHVTEYTQLESDTLDRCINHTMANTSSRDRQVVAVINCESVGFESPIELTKSNDWKRVFNMNLFGPINFISSLMPTLESNKSRIIMMMPMSSSNVVYSN